ncbi:hypothetical protein H0I25_03150 [Cellulophaga sp. HaHa_2_95]|nr:hypothetical protein H0I25_03150 [Cellulophaga sp. HaHa_2_95]
MPLSSNAQFWQEYLFSFFEKHLLKYHPQNHLQNQMRLTIAFYVLAWFVFRFLFCSVVFHSNSPLFALYR